MTPFWIAVYIVCAFVAGLIMGVFVMALCAMASFKERQCQKISSITAI